MEFSWILKKYVEISVCFVIFFQEVFLISQTPQPQPPSLDFFWNSPIIISYVIVIV